MVAGEVGEVGEEDDAVEDVEGEEVELAGEGVGEDPHFCTLARNGTAVGIFDATAAKQLLNCC